MVVVVSSSQSWISLGVTFSPCLASPHLQWCGSFSCTRLLHSHWSRATQILGAHWLTLYSVCWRQGLWHNNTPQGKENTICNGHSVPFSVLLRHDTRGLELGVFRTLSRAPLSTFSVAEDLGDLDSVAARIRTIMRTIISSLDVIRQEQHWDYFVFITELIELLTCSQLHSCKYQRNNIRIKYQ